MTTDPTTGGEAPDVAKLRAIGAGLRKALEELRAQLTPASLSNMTDDQQRIVGRELGRLLALAATTQRDIERMLAGEPPE